MDYKFKNLVFEGGGVKGIAYGGALEILEKKGILANIERVAGTSAGAITAGLLAIGCTSNEIKQTLRDTNFKTFMDDSRGFLLDIRRVWCEFGWFKGEAFEEWFRRHLEQKTGNKKATFGELSERAKIDKKFRKLYIVATNLNKKTVEIFDEERTPNMSIAKAVRMSMSIPLFFKAVNFNQYIYVDGGIYYNYPLNIFDNKKYLFHPEDSLPAPYDTRSGAVYNKETLGMRVDSKDEIERHLRRAVEHPKRIKTLKDYLISFAEGITDNLNKMHLHKNDWHRTIYIDALGVGTTDFDLDEQTIEKLIQSGRDGAKNYFRWFDNPAPTEETPINK